VRPQDFSSRRLPPEWRDAIREAEKRPMPKPLSIGESDDPTQDDSPGPFVHSSELRTLVGRLKRERISRGLTLGDIAKLTQQARSAISRLENGRYSNPTLNTLYRYAQALGWHITLSVQPLTDEQREEDVERGLSHGD
jgi:DNA-binding XRE family transcriptional regulator